MLTISCIKISNTVDKACKIFFKDMEKWKHRREDVPCTGLF